MVEIKIPPPEGENEGYSWIINSPAQLEDKNWANEDVLRGQRKKNAPIQLKFYGYIVPVMMGVFFLLYSSSLIAFAFHYITPWTWLSAEQLSKIQSLIFSGSVGAFVAGVMNKQG